MRGASSGLPYPSVSEERKSKLIGLTEKVGFGFRSLELLNLSFIHKSWANENGSFHNNERLEFLGDAVLGLAVAEWLFIHLSQEREGELARLKSYLVSEEYLAQVAKSLDLGIYLLLGKGEDNSGGREKKALLADAMEAFFGAVYLDADWPTAKNLILGLLEPELRISEGQTGDYKSVFQEWCQKNHRVYPQYRLVSTEGPDHDRDFYVVVEMDGKTLGEGYGKSKKIAEQEAARQGLRWAGQD